MRPSGDGKVQLWPSVKQEVYDEIESLSIKENRKVNEMAAILLENAIKERKRKRNGKAKNSA